MAKFDNRFLRPLQGFTQSKIEKAKHVCLLFHSSKGKEVPKILNKFTEVYIFTIDDHAFFAPTKNLRNSRQGDAVTGDEIPMISTPYKNFKNFPKALNHSKKSEKIHGNSW